MTSTNRKLLCVGAALLLAVLFATASDTVFSARGKLLFKDDFSGPSLDPGWPEGPGNWELVDGAAKISERPQDKHPAVRRRPLKYHDAIFEFSFQLNGARMICLASYTPAGHLCRLAITPKGLTLMTERPTATSDPKLAATLATLDSTIEPGKWHNVVLEFRGGRMLAQLDGQKTLVGESPLLDVDKSQFAFPVGGASALLDNVRVYETASK
jgi:hypothetical protein